MSENLRAVAKVKTRAYNVFHNAKTEMGPGSFDRSEYLVSGQYLESNSYEQDRENVELEGREFQDLSGCGGLGQ